MTRIVSLLPAATEMVALLGATKELVGITHECDFPSIVASRARVTHSALPSPVRDTHTHDAHARDAHDATPLEIDTAVRELNASGAALFTLHEQTIAALRPTLLLTQALCDVCAVAEGDVRALAARLSPVPDVVTLGGTTINGIFDDIARVALALGVPDELEELLAGLRSRLHAVHITLKTAKAPRPRVALIEWTSPVYLGGHWAPEQVHRAGGRDVLGTAGAHSTTVELSALSEADPEIVLVAPCGYALAEARAEASALLHDPAWMWLAGRQVWALNANALTSRPGPRVVDGVETMARIFNPTLFSAVDPEHATRVA